METFSALLPICAGTSPIPGEFPAQRPVMRSFDVFFDLRQNKQLRKQSWGWWSKMPSSSLWRHRNYQNPLLPCVKLVNLLWNYKRHVIWICKRVTSERSVNSLRLGDAQVLEQTGAHYELGHCHLSIFGSVPLPEQMYTYCRLKTYIKMLFNLFNLNVNRNDLF